ncbi:MAG: insulinase family protein [Chloroflexi bacterium]|nr:insulinase family protein [Chloroflexota bacterium]
MTADPGALAAPVTPAPIVQRTLANGAVLLVRERPTAGVVALTVAVRSGARDELPEQAGWRNLLTRAHLLGTARWPTEDLLRRVIGVTGGTIGAATTYELSTFSITVPAAEFPLACEVLSELLNAPRFDEDQLRRDRGLVLLEIQRRQSEPAALAFDTLVEALWRDHPAGHSPLGRRETVERCEPATLRALREQVMVGRNLTVALVGQVEPEQALEALTQAVAPLPAGEPALRPFQPVPPRRQDEQVECQAGQRQAIVLSGLPVPGRLDPDRYPLAVIDAVLGSPAGRLFAEIRTRRALAYAAGTGLNLLTDAGMFYAQAGTDPATLEPVLAVIAQELQRISETPLTAEELAAAVGQLAGQRIMAEETSSAQANQLATLTALGCYETTEAFAQRLRQVSSEEVLRVARRYLTGGRVVVVVRPAV